MQRITTSQERSGIRVLVEFDSADLEQTQTPFGVLLDLDGCALDGEPGGPGLPSCTVRVASPPATLIGAIEVKVIEESAVTDGPTLVAPLQPPMPAARGRGNGGGTKGGNGDDAKGGNGDDDAKRGRGRKPRDEEEELRPSLRRPQEDPLSEAVPPRDFEPPRQEAYDRALREPPPAAVLVTNETIGLNNLAVVQINPVRFGQGGELRFATRIEIMCTTAPATPIDTKRFTAPHGDEVRDGGNGHGPDGGGELLAIHSRAQAERSVELARMMVVNPTAIWDFAPFFPTVLTNVDYLIITDDQRWNEQTMQPIGAVPGGSMVEAFNRLAEWKTRRGLRTHVATITNIVGGRYGNFRTGAADLQEVLRNFVKFAHRNWGVAWLLLGGDIDVVPVRRVPGASEGHINTDSTDPPEANRSFFTGVFLKMNVQQPGIWFPATAAGLQLVRADNGLLIPFDAAGTSGPTQRGWFFTTNDTYTVRSATPTQFVRVNGPAAEINARMQWLYRWNMLPTDLYYSSLTGPTYSLPGRRDWDLLRNGIYGQHTNDADMDGVQYRADVSVGRAPVATKAQADAFVTKTIAYEQFRRPDGTPLSSAWTRRMLFVAENWGGRLHITPTTANPPQANRYHRAAGADRAVIRLADAFNGLDWRLIAHVAGDDFRVLPYRRDASTSVRGWRYVLSATNHAPSETVINFVGIVFRIPLPSQWAVVFGATAELSPQRFIFDHVNADGSMTDQEQLRVQVAAELPQINSIMRLYQDDIDLTPAQRAAAPIQHLTAERVREQIEAGPHYVSLSGHGNADGCCGLSRPMADALGNGYHTFIGYADSCLTNEFDAEDAVSEHLVNNPNGGAVAYVGNSRFSWIGVGDNFQRAFFRRLAQTRHLGLLNDTRCAMVNENTGFWRLYNKWQIFSLNLIGDPETPAWVGPPATMRVEFHRELDNRLPFTVRVTRRLAFLDVPLVGARVHVRQGTFQRHAIAGANGVATFDITAARLGALEVTVTRNGFLPFFGAAEVVGPAWVTGKVRLIAHQHPAADRTLIRLELATPLDGQRHRAWHARRTRPDYGVILDAATDAYISDETIHFMVDSIRDGGAIERFRFGAFPLRVGGVDLIATELVRPVTLDVLGVPVQQLAFAGAEEDGAAHGFESVANEPAVPQEAVAAGDDGSATIAGEADAVVSDFRPVTLEELAIAEPVGPQEPVEASGRSFTGHAPGGVDS